MLIGLKLNPVHLSLSTSAPLAHPARPFAGTSPVPIYCEQKSEERFTVDLRSSRMGYTFGLSCILVSIFVATFVSANPIRGTAGPSFLRKRPFAPIRGCIWVYELCVPRYVYGIPRRMEELFSGARPLSPFYGDVKLISDSMRCGRDRKLW